MASAMRKMAVYLGLVEDERRYQDSYDAYGDYDGGWALGAPYLITLEPGADKITYRIASRTLLERGVAYYLCPDGKTLCQAPR